MTATLNRNIAKWKPKCSVGGCLELVFFSLLYYDIYFKSLILCSQIRANLEEVLEMTLPAPSEPSVQFVGDGTGNIQKMDLD
mgnify:CR=1 FL=1